MCNIVSVDDVAGSVDGFAEMCGELTNPDSEAGSASSQTPGVVSIDVRILVVPKAIHLVS